MKFFVEISIKNSLLFECLVFCKIFSINIVALCLSLIFFIFFKIIKCSFGIEYIITAFKCFNLSTKTSSFESIWLLSSRYFLFNLESYKEFGIIVQGLKTFKYPMERIC